MCCPSFSRPSPTAAVGFSIAAPSPPTWSSCGFEVQLRSLVDLYASILAAGLELTRGSHLALTDQCTCRKNAAAVADLGQIVTLRLEISFLEDMTLHSLLGAGSAPA